MKLTIIAEDKAVYVDGVCYSDLPLSTVPTDVHALQWEGTAGWIEFNDGKNNEPIDALPQWANDSVSSWEVANTPPPVETTTG